MLASCSPVTAPTLAPPAPAVTLSASSLAFSVGAVGVLSTPKTVVVSNSGTAALNVRGVSIVGTDASMFTQVNTCTSPLPPGTSCTVSVTFTPASTGQKNASLAVQTDAPTSTSVALQGAVDLSAANVAGLKALFAAPHAIAAYNQVSTRLASDLAPGATTITLVGVNGFPTDADFIVELADGVNTEYVLVIAGFGTTTWTALRGYNGSTAEAFSAATTTVSWVPLAAMKGDTINGTPVTSIVATFAASVGGGTSGTLTAAVPNGIYHLTFDSGESRDVTVQLGTFASWGPALAPGTVMTATTSLTLAPAGMSAAAPAQLLTQRFDLGAPVYITQKNRLTRRGAVLTADLPASGAATMTVDSTVDFPQAGSFVVNTGYEDVLVSVADATTLTLLARAQNGTHATALTGAATTFYQVMEADFGAGGGTQAFYVAATLNSGKSYLGVAATVGALREYKPKQPVALHFVLDGSYFELLAEGNIAALVIADGVIQHAPNSIVEPTYSGCYWHKFDFGSRRVRKITLLLAAYPMSIAWAATDTLTPWNRSQDPFVSFDGDSFGETEGYSWQSAPDGGGLGLYLEAMLALGISQFDYAAPVGGTGYSQEGPSSPPVFPRPKYSGVHRVAAVVAGPAPAIFVGGLGHNDNGIGRQQFAADTLAYWTAIRAAWPSTVLVAAQYFFPAAGAQAPAAFEPNPRSTPNDPAILAALEAVGGPWVFINTNLGTWQNSSGVTGVMGVSGEPLITGVGYGGAPGYAGGHATGVGNGDLMIRDDGIHPSNLGARYLGTMTAQAITAGILALP